MKKNTYSKALYHFSKKQKNKGSNSTKDLNDSLDQLQLPESNLGKKIHQRTQSCPSASLIPRTNSTQNKMDTIQRLEKYQTTRSLGKNFKKIHRNWHSQAEIESLAGNQYSISIDSLSSVLYRKNSKQSILKKSRMGEKSKLFSIERDNYDRVRLDQQMKKYELSEQMAQLEKRTKGIILKQQILEALLGKFDRDLTFGSQQLLSP